tara:strand:+ start:247 stop:792 length:546 start_codon:yes stop_codon:yes gene_type:complete
MTKNSFGGKHFKKKKKHNNVNNREFITKKLDPNSDEQYAKILQRLGDRMVLGIDESGNQRKLRIRGKHYKKVYFNPEDIVLINYDKSKKNSPGEIILKYTNEEIERLKTIGHLNEYIFSKPEDLCNENVEFERNTSKDFYGMLNENISKNNCLIENLDKNDRLELDGDDYDSDSSVDIDDI